MRIIQSPLLSRKVKKLPKTFKVKLDDQVRQIIENPELGVLKKGDLQGVQVHKFKVNGQLQLLAYRYGDERLQLIMLGSHQNFYKNLRGYL